eukprot:gnl/TRDRNA2_/TRDRNA2_158876_c0_seq1.p1 gnl/TRDRNA2_/TRDRNA2_158876_c0~~gnl/TRDRNA2_/TRDRNA2_158876_c0_seq1.p1  ORF type:complete len:355 (+),score=19.73 gnl/TRDRNA2_/TRDRNA2_158876_c0_seq1:106-1170(+)
MAPSPASANATLTATGANQSLSSSDRKSISLVDQGSPTTRRRASAAPVVHEDTLDRYKALYSTPSIQAQLELNDIPESAQDPGPGHYFHPDSYGFSSLGNQKFSKCASAPEIEIPRTGWDQWAKVRISKGHSRVVCGQDSPGPIYGMPSSLNLKAAKIGTSLRPDLSRALGVDPDGSPGPQAYTLPRYDPLNKSCSVKKDRSFGRSARFAVQQGAGNIGPGQYSRKDQCLDLKTGRSFGIGRSYYDRVIRPGWEREGQGRDGPGPGSPLWRDLHKDGSRAYSIGTAQRFPADRSVANPGPGAYDRRERDMSNLSSYLSDTRTPTTVVFGAHPSKPRLRLGLIGLTCERGCWGYF